MHITPRHIAAGFCFGLLVLHVWSAFISGIPKMFLMHAIAFVYDVSLLGMSTIILNRLVGRNYISGPIIASFGLVLASYPLLLTEFLSFPVNLFATDLAIARFFITMLFGISGVLAIFLVGIVAAVAIYFRLGRQVSGKKWLFGLVVILSVAGIVMGEAQFNILSPQPHPLIFSLQETTKNWATGTKRVVPRLKMPSAASADTSDNETIELTTSPLQTLVNFNYDHLLILVMETVNEQRFAHKFITNKDGFFSKIKDQTAYFSQYYTNNLDSYTSLIAMLTSVQTPYRAYDRSELFAGVNHAPNLVRALTRKGWKSMFVCTTENQPFIPIKQNWDKIVTAGNIPAAKWASVGINAIEAAIEDKAAIAPMVSFMEKNEKTVIMHEMVYGHSPRWMAVTGKDQLAYYDEYFQELYISLQQATLADKTLIVIVADHGERNDATVAANYHVPLLVIGKHVKSATMRGMFSHTDLQGIIRHYMSSEAASLPPARDDTLVVGHSGRWIYGLITSDNRNVFIDAIDGNVLGGNKTDMTPEVVFARFQKHINSFLRYQRLEKQP